MKLDDFLKALKTKDVKILILNNDEEEIIKFYSDGYSGVESDVREQEVLKWFVTGVSSIKVYVDATASSNEEPTNSDEPSTDEPTNNEPLITGTSVAP